MGFFTSSREIRLWLWTGTAVTGIFLSLFYAQTLSGLLRADGMAEFLFGAGVLMIGVMVAALGLSTRPRPSEIAVLIAVITIYAMVFVRMTSAAERTHIIEYSVVAALIYEALTERKANGRKTPSPPVTALIVTTTIGIIDEFVQLIIPARIFDWADIRFNAFAAALAIGAMHIVTLVRRRKKN